MSFAKSQDTNILLLEDDEVDQLTIKRIINNHQTKSKLVEISSISEFDIYFKNGELHDIDLIIMDLGLPDGDALKKINLILSSYKLMKIIVISGQEDVRVAVKALEHGASSYIVKGQKFNMDFLSSYNSTMRQIKLEKLIQNYIEFIFKPANFPVAVFSLSENGPIVHMSDFESLPIPRDIDLDSFLFNMSITAITAVGQGQKYYEGFYEHPVRYLPDYKTLMLSKIITNKKSSDERLHRKSIVIFCFFIPKDIKYAMPEMSKFEDSILTFFDEETDLEQIDFQFVQNVKSRILNYIKINFNLHR